MTPCTGKPGPARIVGRRRSISRLLAGAGLTLAMWAATSTPALAAFPERPIRLIIGFPGRRPAGHPRPPAGPTACSNCSGSRSSSTTSPGPAARSGPNSLPNRRRTAITLLVANTGTMVINPALYPKLPYTMLRDLVPVARTAQQPLALIVNPAVPARDIREFIRYAKANPGKLNYASAGNGGISHLVPEMFKQATGVFMVHLPYRGSAPAFSDVLAGHAQFMAESIPQVTQYVKQGKVRALAVTSRERSPALPDVPTLIESGLSQFDVVGFYGVLGAWRHAARGAGTTEPGLPADPRDSGHPSPDAGAGSRSGLPVARDIRQLPARRITPAGRRRSRPREPSSTKRLGKGRPTG
jgi:tripartite-type tricarboxylate transporter receptor subunit TctC